MNKTNKRTSKRNKKINKTLKAGSLTKKDKKRIENMNLKIQEINDEIYVSENPKEIKRLEKEIKVLEKKIKLIEENKPVKDDSLKSNDSLSSKYSDSILSDVTESSIKTIKESPKKRKIMPMIKFTPVLKQEHEVIYEEELPVYKIKEKPTTKVIKDIEPRKSSIVDIKDYLKSIGKRMTKKSHKIAIK